MKSFRVECLEKTAYRLMEYYTREERIAYLARCEIERDGKRKRQEIETYLIAEANRRKAAGDMGRRKKLYGDAA